MLADIEMLLRLLQQDVMLAAILQWNILATIEGVQHVYH